jgi:cephalosporin-C deacetylase
MSIPTQKPFGFDPTYGYSLDALRAVRALDAPPGFDEIWRARYVLAQPRATWTRGPSEG